MRTVENIVHESEYIICLHRHEGEGKDIQVKYILRYLEDEMYTPVHKSPDTCLFSI